MAQVIQIIGALIILGAFAGSQLGNLPTDSRRYLALNVVGSAILCVLAVVEGQIGFVLLEGVWAIVSAWSLFVLLGEEAQAAEEAVATEEVAAAEEVVAAEEPGPPAV
jgi:fucose permease